MNARDALVSAKRIVVKAGTNVVMQDDGGLALSRLYGLIESVARLRHAGREVLVVSSGAVGLGTMRLGLPAKPKTLAAKQAAAAVGQGRLMALYADAFEKLGLVAAQVLLTEEDFTSRERYLNLSATLEELFKLGVVPILNENDTVSTVELKPQEGRSPVFGDNDRLSALVASKTSADLLVLLTDVDGLYTANPRVDPGAQRIPYLERVDDDSLARAIGGSAGGTGGMRSKLDAARFANEGGVDVLIANGYQAGVLDHALAGHDVGTFVPTPERRPERLRQIALTRRCEGALILNEGAVMALTERKASLLPIGVTAVEGDFAVGSVVELRDASGRVRGRGLVNYASDACRQLAGHHSREIDRILGWRGYDALVTRDNLVLGDVDA